MSDVLIDTNIPVYVINKDSEYFERANSFLTNPENNLYTTSKNIIEFLSVITRLTLNPLNSSDAMKIASDFLQFIKVLYPNPKSFDIFKRLVLKYKLKGLLIHDYEIASISLSYGKGLLLFSNSFL